MVLSPKILLPQTACIYCVHTHTYMLTKKVILVAESCGVWFVFCSFTGNRYVCACGLTAFPFSSLQSECGDGGGVIWHD